MLHKKGSTRIAPIETSEAAIFGRLFDGRNGSLSRTVARRILEISFTDTDQDRMEELAQRNQHGLITVLELEELRNYVKVGDLLAILHSKARQALRKRKSAQRIHA